MAAGCGGQDIKDPYGINLRSDPSPWCGARAAGPQWCSRRLPHAGSLKRSMALTTRVCLALPPPPLGDGHKVTVPPHPSSSVTQRNNFFGACGALYFLYFLGQVTAPPTTQGRTRGRGGGVTILCLVQVSLCVWGSTQGPEVSLKKQWSPQRSAEQIIQAITLMHHQFDCC